MTIFNEKLRLRGQAAEDIYFAKRDQELIENMHQKEYHSTLDFDSNNDDKKEIEFESHHH